MTDVTNQQYTSIQDNDESIYPEVRWWHAAVRCLKESGYNNDVRNENDSIYPDVRWWHAAVRCLENSGYKK
jgi:hypothetical protein